MSFSTKLIIAAFVALSLTAYGAQTASTQGIVENQAGGVAKHLSFLDVFVFAYQRQPSPNKGKCIYPDRLNIEGCYEPIPGHKHFEYIKDGVPSNSGELNCRGGSTGGGQYGFGRREGLMHCEFDVRKLAGKHIVIAPDKKAPKYGDYKSDYRVGDGRGEIIVDPSRIDTDLFVHTLYAHKKFPGVGGVNDDLVDELKDVEKIVQDILFGYDTAILKEVKRRRQIAVESVDITAIYADEEYSPNADVLLLPGTHYVVLKDRSNNCHIYEFFFQFEKIMNPVSGPEQPERRSPSVYKNIEPIRSKLVWEKLKCANELS